MFWRQTATLRWVASSGILALGMVAGGYLFGNGLLRAHWWIDFDICIPWRLGLVCKCQNRKIY